MTQLCEYEQLGQPQTDRSAREVVGEIIRDPLLVEMLFCPVLYYGGAKEHDMDFGQFSILFRSIFFEGLARPLAGVRLILKKLVQKFKNLGGELRLRAGVSRISVKDDSVTKVVLEDGAELEGKQDPLVGRLAGNHAALRYRTGRVGRPKPAVAGRVDFDSQHSAEHAGSRQNNRLFQRFRKNPLRKAA